MSIDRRQLRFLWLLQMMWTYQEQQEGAPYTKERERRSEWDGEGRGWGGHNQAKQ